MLPARPHVRHFISHKDTLVSNITAPSVGKNSKLKPGCTFPFFFLNILLLSVQLYLCLSNTHPHLMSHRHPPTLI